MTSDQKADSPLGSAQSKVTYLMNAVMTRSYARIRRMGLLREGEIVRPQPLVRASKFARTRCHRAG